jgi:hypothetical protein
LIEESRKLTFGGSLTVITPHQVRVILQQKVGRWLTDSRTLNYEAILLELDDLTLTTKNHLNPAEFLLGGKTQDPIEHCCLDIIEYQTKVRPDLRETPFLDGFKSFIDSSSKMFQGKRHNGYSVVDGEKLKVIESGRLPNNWLAQTCELFALNQALKFLKDKKNHLYRF